MVCPYCKNPNTRVLDKRDTNDKTTRRRRECENCSKRFTTYERIETVLLSVMKRDGRVEEFDDRESGEGVRRLVILTESRGDPIFAHNFADSRRNRNLFGREQNLDVANIIYERGERFAAVIFINNSTNQLAQVVIIDADNLEVRGDGREQFSNVIVYTPTPEEIEGSNLALAFSLEVTGSDEDVTRLMLFQVDAPISADGTFTNIQIDVPHPSQIEESE